MKNTQNLVFSKKMIHLCMRLRCYGYNSRFGKDSYGSVHRGEEVKSLFSDDWGNHLETEYGNQFATEYGNQFATEYGNQFITEYGNQFATEYGNQLGSDWLLTKIIGYKRQNSYLCTRLIIIRIRKSIPLADRKPKGCLFSAEALPLFYNNRYNPETCIILPIALLLWQRRYRPKMEKQTSKKS